MQKIILFFLLIVSLKTSGQDGHLDASFGNDGIVITDMDNSHDFGMNVAQQADGKLVVLGITSATWGPPSYPFLVRYMSDGSLDTGFGVGGKLIINIDGYSDSMELFIDGEQYIIIGGFVSGNQNFILKYRPDGILDPSFATGGVLTLPASTGSRMIPLPDNSLIFVTLNNGEISLSHYMEDGTLDTNFGVGGTATSIFSGDIFRYGGAKGDGNGNIYILGTRDIPLAADIILMKFGSDGYLISSFGNNGVATQTIDAMNPMNYSSAGFDFTNDGKIIIAGSSGACIDENQSIRQSFFLKYESNGSPDIGFGNNGTFLLPMSGFEMMQLFIQTNQKMVVTGRHQDCFEGSHYTGLRYFSNGYRDYSFSGGPDLELEYHRAIMQEDGKIVGVGNTPWFNGPEDIVLFRQNNNALSVPQFEKPQVRIHPNPSEGIFLIEDSSSLGNGFYRITDITGKVVSKGELQNRTQIDLTAFQSGMYFFRTGNEVIRLLKY